MIQNVLNTLRSSLYTRARHARSKCHSLVTSRCSLVIAKLEWHRLIRWRRTVSLNRYKRRRIISVKKKKKKKTISKWISHISSGSVYQQTRMVCIEKRKKILDNLCVRRCPLFLYSSSNNCCIGAVSPNQLSMTKTRLLSGVKKKRVSQKKTFVFLWVLTTCYSWLHDNLTLWERRKERKNARMKVSESIVCYLMIKLTPSSDNWKNQVETYRVKVWGRDAAHYFSIYNKVTLKIYTSCRI